MILKKIFAPFVHTDKPAEKAETPIKEEQKPTEEKSKEMMDYLSSAGNINRAAVVSKPKEDNDGYINELTQEDEDFGLTKHLCKYQDGEKIEEITEDVNGEIISTKYKDNGLYELSETRYEDSDECHTTEIYFMAPDKPVFQKISENGEVYEHVISYYPSGEKLCDINGKYFTVYNKNGEVIEGMDPKYTLLLTQKDSPLSSEIKFHDNRQVKQYSLDFEDRRITYNFADNGSLISVTEEAPGEETETKNLENLY